MKKPRYLVSACLAGCPCRYDGKSSPVKEIMQIVQSGEAITFCPEALGGLPTPRRRCEIREADSVKSVFTVDGSDCTGSFVRGAELSLELAVNYGIKEAILKSRSPSCGYGEIYDGTFSGVKIKGNGITADLFIKHGIKIYTELTFQKNCDS